MAYAWQMELKPRTRAVAALLPPPMVEEPAWDILLALHCHGQCGLSPEKLSMIVSVPSQRLISWLAHLEDSGLVSGLADAVTHEVRAVLTVKGRALLDNFISATTDLQVSAHH